MEFDGPCPPDKVEERIGESNRFEIDEACHRLPINEDVYRCEVAVVEDCLTMGKRVGNSRTTSANAARY
jgi:hypothetical protein